MPRAAYRPHSTSTFDFAHGSADIVAPARKIFKFRAVAERQH
jgi:hypothetical protein